MNLRSIAGWSQRHHWLALVLWLVTLGGITVAAQAIGSDYRDDNSLPGTQSQRVVDLSTSAAASGTILLQEHAPAQAGDSIQIVVQHDQGLSQPSTRDRVEATLASVRTLPHVAAVQSLYDSANTVSQNGTIGYATVQLDAKAGDVPDEDVRRIIDTAKTAERDGLHVELSGGAIRGAEEAEGGAAEGAGILAALVILVLMFGSLLAATLPLITAIFAVGSTLGIITLASHLIGLPSFAPPQMMLVGIGVGIDYALLIFARYRGELLNSAEREQAARTALDTAGRSVLFAGGTVMIALLGLLALGLGSLQGAALAVALTVLVTMVASLTLLPALLTVFGRRIERSVRKRAERAEQAGREPGRRWRRWGNAVQRRPLAPLGLAVGALVALSVPTIGMHLGFADAGTEAPSTTSRQAYDLLAEGFGPGFAGPLVVVSVGDTKAAEVLHQTITATPGIAGATPPRPMGDGRLALVLAFPSTSPQDAATSDLVARLRTEVLPPLAESTGARYLVGGSTAAADDFAGEVSDRLPLFILVVVGLSALLLMAVFRSLLIPLKAAVLNLLSIGASLGVITLVFQHGLFGVQQGPIEAFVPVMIFAIVFGLSMDYEVFLVSRMHEQWRRTGDANRSVREGLALTGGVITAAAAIMIAVFGAFLLSPDRMLQQFGLGLGVAVLLDALVIRCLVVPAVMRLLGTRAWWLPRWLDRGLPRIALERE